jgi:hypothetical protein
MGPVRLPKPSSSKVQSEFVNGWARTVVSIIAETKLNVRSAWVNFFMSSSFLERGLSVCQRAKPAFPASMFLALMMAAAAAHHELGSFGQIP